MDLNNEVIGLLAGFLTTLAFLPQFIKTWKSKSTKDISYGMYFIFCSGVTLWTFYGYRIGALSIIIANVMTLILSVSILLMKMCFERAAKKKQTL